MNLKFVKNKYHELPFPDAEDYINSLSDEDVEILHRETSAISDNVPSYEEYKNLRRKHYSGICFVGGCMEPAEFEVGDARYYCGMCEKHSGIRGDYVRRILDIAFPRVSSNPSKPHGGAVGL